MTLQIQARTHLSWSSFSARETAIPQEASSCHFCHFLDDFARPRLLLLLLLRRWPFPRLCQDASPIFLDVHLEATRARPRSLSLPLVWSQTSVTGWWMILAWLLESARAKTVTECGRLVASLASADGRLAATVREALRRAALVVRRTMMVMMMERRGGRERDEAKEEE